MKKTCAAVVTVLTLTACGGAAIENDEAGLKACEMLDSQLAQKGRLSVEEVILGGSEIAEVAQRSEIDDISGAVEPLFDDSARGELAFEADPEIVGTLLIDTEELKAACEDAGYEF